MKNTIYALAVLCAFSSCENEQYTTEQNTALESKVQEESMSRKTLSVKGMTYTKSNEDFDTASETIVSALETAPPVNILTEVFFSENADALGLVLNPMKVIIFGNPALGTPLMQQNQLAGLDLPQKLLIFEDESETVRVAFNNISYLKARHGLKRVESLSTISGALANFASTVSDGKLKAIQARSIKKGEGIITKISTKSFQETYDSLIAAINANPSVRLFAEQDHQANAASVGMDLNPTSLVIFGNPNMGTPLMQNTQTVGMDLPQKMLVWEDDQGVVRVSYNDPAYLTKRHSITGNEDIQAGFTMGLNNLSNVAAGL